MSLFEVVMVVCFGCAWPASIWKSWISRDNTGKSLPFLFIILTGYGAGLLHKAFYSRDGVIWLYGLNAFMVGLDILLWFRNGRRMRKAEASCEARCMEEELRKPA